VSSRPGLPTDNSIADIAERVVDSVVNISIEAEVQADPFTSFFSGGDDLQKLQGKGSGVIITASGRILTNAHVVNGADRITVTLQDGTDLPAKVVGKDTKADLAVIQLEGKMPALKPIPWGDSSQLRLGELVLAVGDGLGVGKSVSLGIVSAKGRGLGIAEYEDFLQTDAAINKGNSGGALVNMRGELVGVNTAIASETGGYSGIGFAIPTNMAKPIMEMLMKDGKVSRGYLGINIATVSSLIAKKYELGASKGVLVAGIEPAGPAAKAGLVEGDVITAINGNEVRTDAALRNTIAMTKPGTTVALDFVHRNGKTASAKAKLGELPDDQPAIRGNMRQRPMPKNRRFVSP
jgi:Do/DeqQ family serine protease